MGDEFGAMAFGGFEITKHDLWKRHGGKGALRHGGTVSMIEKFRTRLLTQPSRLIDAAGEAAVADDVGRKDRCDFPGFSHRALKHRSPSHKDLLRLLRVGLTCFKRTRGPESSRLTGGLGWDPSRGNHRTVAPAMHGP
jgi:hypothetical protein